MKVPSFIKRIFFGAITTWITAILVGKVSALWTAWNTESLNYELALKQIRTCNTQKDVQINFAKMCKEAIAISKHWPFLKAIELVINDFHATTDFYIYTILNSWLFVLLCLIVTGVIIFQISNFFKRKADINYMTRLKEERQQRNEVIELIPSSTDYHVISNNNNNNRQQYPMLIGTPPPTTILRSSSSEYNDNNNSAFQKRKKQKVVFIDNDQVIE
jgi:hypothetical protein